MGAIARLEGKTAAGKWFQVAVPNGGSIRPFPKAWETAVHHQVLCPKIKLKSFLTFMKRLKGSLLVKSLKTLTHLCGNNK